VLVCNSQLSSWESDLRHVSSETYSRASSKRASERQGKTTARIIANAWGEQGRIGGERGKGDKRARGTESAGDRVEGGRERERGVE